MKTAPQDIATVAMHLIGNPDLRQKNGNSAYEWLLIAAEIVSRLADISYENVRIEADYTRGKNRCQATYMFVRVGETLLRVTKSSSHPKIKQSSMDAAQDDIRNNPLLRLQDPATITVKASVDSKKQGRRIDPTWLAALVSSWQLQLQTASAARAATMQRPPRL